MDCKVACNESARKREGIILPHFFVCANLFTRFLRLYASRGNANGSRTRGCCWDQGPVSVLLISFFPSFVFFSFSPYSSPFSILFLPASQPALKLTNPATCSLLKQIMVWVHCRSNCLHTFTLFAATLSTVSFAQLDANEFLIYLKPICIECFKKIWFPKIRSTSRFPSHLKNLH